VKGEGENYPRFPSEIGIYGPTYCFGLRYEKLSCVRLAVGGEDCSLDSPVEQRRRRGIYEAKTGLVLGF
jgi:hypothetical protein